MAERIVFDQNAARHIYAYIDFNNQVGDVGRQITDKEAEELMRAHALV